MSGDPTQTKLCEQIAGFIECSPPAVDFESLAAALADASKMLSDSNHALGKLARQLLPQSTGLSSEMVDWALVHSLQKLSTDSFLELFAHTTQGTTPTLERVPSSLSVIVLAGNTFTAALRPLAEALLHSEKVIAKASVQDALFPTLFAQALKQANEQIANRLLVLEVSREENRVHETLFQNASVVAVYGSDHTITEIRKQLATSTRLIAHGHGLGVIFVPAAALSNPEKRKQWADAAALDIAAYDQRGCMSPQAIYLEENDSCPAQEFAELLAKRSLAKLSQHLPRGTLPLHASTAQFQWRAVAQAQANLYEGDGFAVSCEKQSAFRLSPGYRNIAVMLCNSMGDFCSRIQSLRSHLKVIGVAGDSSLKKNLARQLSSQLVPRICSVGQMQLPPLNYIQDGLPPSCSFSSYRELALPEH